MIRILELFWLTMMILGIIFAIWDSIINGFAKSWLDFGLPLMFSILYLLRRHQRIRSTRPQENFNNKIKK